MGAPIQLAVCTFNRFVNVNTEIQYNGRHKDRRSKVSRLTKRESFHFQRALYRIMLVSWLYGMGSIPESDMQDEHYPYTFYEVYQSRQTNFLMKYPSDDLFEINRIARILIYTATIAMGEAVYQRHICEWIFVLQRIAISISL